MIKPEEAQKILNETGIMTKAVAAKTGLCRTYISEWLNNRRLLSNEHLQAVDRYFEKIKVIM